MFRNKLHLTRRPFPPPLPLFRPFGCDFCSMRFAIRDKLSDHLVNQHGTASNPFECDDCDQRFTRKMELDWHVLSSHNEVEPISSPHSNSKLMSTSSIKYSCPICTKVFGKKGHFVRHLRTHEAEKPFGCDFCSKRFASKYSLQIHFLNRHKIDIKPFECNLCDRRFTLKKELDRHIESHKDGIKRNSFPCDNCELKFTKLTDLYSHLELIHPTEEVFKCAHCEKTFLRKYSLIRHERAHTNGTEKDYQCEVCNKEFGTRYGIQMHLQTHERSKNKPFACRLCNKKFAVQLSLDIHLDFHNQSEEKPFSCEVCEIRFNSQKRLDNHIATHGSNEGRLFTCQYCARTFPRKYNLIRHEVSHTHGRKKPKDGLPIPIHEGLAQVETRVMEKHNDVNQVVCVDILDGSADEEDSPNPNIHSPSLHEEQLFLVSESN